MTTVGWRSIGDILSGRREISTPVAKRLADFFNVSADLFIWVADHRSGRISGSRPRPRRGSKPGAFHESARIVSFRAASPKRKWLNFPDNRDQGSDAHRERDRAERQGPRYHSACMILDIVQ